MSAHKKQDNSNTTRKASRTAILVAVVRASHLLWNHPPVFSDPYALHMITPFWRYAAKRKWLKWLIGDVALRAYKPVHTESLLRSRYAEDRLHEAIESGIGQYVILGAGLDTFSLRQVDLSERLRVFELDHPASQAMKREKLIEINGHVPCNLVLVPVDFETDRLDTELRRNGFNTDAPTFFSWLGTTYYLTREAISQTLEQISSIAATGSRIVFDYKYPHELLQNEELKFTKKMEEFVARRGEPMISMFTPEEINEELSRVGFREIESVPPEEANRRYLQGRTDMVASAPGLAFALFDR